jgi:hypothetical protein
MFEYVLNEDEDQDQGLDHQMAAYLMIMENDQSILFRFKTQEIEIYENGNKITRVMQSGLCAFIRVIEGYLTNIGADPYLSKLPTIAG